MISPEIKKHLNKNLNISVSVWRPHTYICNFIIHLFTINFNGNIYVLDISINVLGRLFYR